MSGRLERPGPAGRARDGLEEARMEASDRMEALRGRVEEVGSGARERVGEVAGRARDRIGEARAGASRKTSDLRGRGSRMLEETSVGRSFERHPLVVLSLAFGAGFLLAGTGDRRTSGISYKAKQQIRGAVMAAATAALAQKGRSLLGMESGHEGLASLFGSEARTGHQRTRSTRPRAKPERSARPD